MNDQIQDLARRAVACKHWRWMPGMNIQEVFGSWRIIHSDAGLLSDGRSLPDLTDPATLGCLLALVREAYGFTLWLSLQRTNWTWFVDGISGVLAHGLSEAEALVAALEAAP